MRHQSRADCNIPKAVHYQPISETGKIAVGVTASASGSPLPSAGERLGVRGMQSLAICRYSTVYENRAHANYTVAGRWQPSEVSRLQLQGNGISSNSRAARKYRKSLGTFNMGRTHTAPSKNEARAHTGRASTLWFPSPLRGLRGREGRGCNR